MTKFFQKYQRENRLNMTRNKDARRKRPHAGIINDKNVF